MTLDNEETEGATTYEFDNDLWAAYNKEYYKYRVECYNAMYKVPAIVNLRKLVRDVRDSSQWKKIEKDFKYLVKTDRHKEMVKMQVDTFNKAANFMKMSEDDA